MPLAATHPSAAPRSFASRALAPLALLVGAACVGTRGGDVGPIVTDRPDFTESAVAVPAGRTQVEAGATYAQEAGIDVTTVGEILVRTSLGARRELRIGVPTYVVVSGTGSPLGDVSAFGDANLGAKLELFTPAVGASRLQPAVGVIVGTSLPIGDRAFRADDPEPEAKLLLAWTVTDRFAIASNLNVARVSSGGESYTEPSASLTGALSLSDRLGSYLELYGFAPNVDDAPRPTYLNGGLTWLLTSDFQLDGRIGIGIADAPDSRFVGVGLSRRW